MKNSLICRPVSTLLAIRCRADAGFDNDAKAHYGSSAFTLLAGSAVLPAVSRRPPRQPHRQLLFAAPNSRSTSTAPSAGCTPRATTGKYEAWLEAWTELKDGRFSYQIVSERGSDMARGKVLRPMLAREQELVNKRRTAASRSSPPPTTNSPRPAATATARASSRSSRGVRTSLLVDGRAVLNDGGDLLRVEGKLSKNPSFWTSLVNIVRRYARIGGVRVPVATETTAKVKFVGTAQLEVALRLPERQRPAGRAQRAALSSARAYRCAIRFVSRRDVSVLTSIASACSSSRRFSAGSAIVAASAT